MSLVNVTVPDGKDIKEILDDFNDFVAGKSVGFAADAISAGAVSLGYTGNSGGQAMMGSYTKRNTPSSKNSNTAKIAFDDYAKVGTVSSAGALTIGATLSSNMALASTGSAVTGMAVGFASPAVILAAILPLFGFAITDATKIPPDVWDGFMSDILTSAFRKSPFVKVQTGAQTIPVLIDNNNNIFVVRNIINKIGARINNIFDWTPYTATVSDLNDDLKAAFPRGIGYNRQNRIIISNYKGGYGLPDITSGFFYDPVGNDLKVHAFGILPSDSVHPIIGGALSTPFRARLFNNPAYDANSYTYQGKTVYYAYSILSEINAAVASTTPKLNISSSPLSFFIDAIMASLCWSLVWGDAAPATRPAGIDVSPVAPRDPAAEDNQVIDVVSSIIDGAIAGLAKWERITLPSASDPENPAYDSSDNTYASQTETDVSNIGDYTDTTVDPNQYVTGKNLPTTGDRTAPLPDTTPTDYNPSLPDVADNPSDVAADDSAITDLAGDEFAPSPSGGWSPPPGFPPKDIPFPTIVSAGSGLIHVYNPTPSEMKSFGQWLWVTMKEGGFLIGQNQRLWNNPFDGVIGAFELYASPSVNGRDNIRSGFLACPTEADLISVRYFSINCGSIPVPEYYGNYLDYSPYTKVHVYLPFIGIVELNSDDIIGHGVNITYRIDAYNGSCIAQITVAKKDYENTMYQFSGNCSVEVPLAGGSQAAIKASLIGAAASGIGSFIQGVASVIGGSLAGFGGAAAGIGNAYARSVSSKSSVQHSGTFGDSCGAMGIKKPYLIVHRPVQKGVVNYNEIYGFPAHKAVRIGACTGFLRVREIHVESSQATDEEKARIEQMLKEGVIVS